MAPPPRVSIKSAASLALVTLAVSGCQAPDSPRIIRLVDVADRTIIAESPLLEPAPTVAPRATTVWDSGSEGDLRRGLGWPDQGGAEGGWVATDARYGKVVCFNGHGRGRFELLIPAEPLVRYRVKRVLKTDWAELDLRVVESSIGPSRGEPAKGDWTRRLEVSNTILGKGAMLAAHRFGGDSGAEWTASDLDFTSNLSARTIGIVFDQVNDALRPSEARTCLAQLSVERLDPDPQQEVALLRDAWANEEDRELGLIKRGRLLPLRGASASKPPYDGNFEVRDALFTPAPTRLRFPLTLPEDARLTFSYGLSAGSQIGDEVQFEVVVEHNGRSENIFRQQAAIGRLGDGWHWRDAIVDLAQWAGEDVVLELRTSSPTARGFGLWANPVIDAPRRKTDPPNVVLIGIDTLRADRLSVYGHSRQTSPNLDRLAADGIRFAQAISASNWTSPSFASIFTGLTASSHGVVNQEFSMNRDVETLADSLRRGGWRTHAVVYKAALYGIGLDQGFDRWFNLPTSHRTAQTNLDKALAFLDTVKDRRFFLFLHLDDPHQPFNQPAPFDRQFGDLAVHERLGLELPISIRNGGVTGCEKCRQDGKPTDDFVGAAQDLYDGAIAYTDDRIGALVEALQVRGIYRDTVIAVVADHGEVIYDRNRLWGHGSLLLADELVHVPLIIKPAGSSALSGRVVHTQVRTTDLLPTLLEAVGLPSTPGADSLSLWPLVDGDEQGDRVAFIENPQGNIVGLRTADWKYVLRSNQGLPLRFLYDLKQDPGELVNVAKKRPSEAARLEELLAGFLLRTRTGPFLLVVGDGEAGAFQLVVERQGGGAERSLIGLPVQHAAEPDDHEVAGGGRVLALVQLDLAPGQTVHASLLTGGRTLEKVLTTGESLSPYDPGLYDPKAWARLLASPGVYVLRGPEQVGATHVGPPTQVDQVEDLRALGYIN